MNGIYRRKGEYYIKFNSVKFGCDSLKHAMLLYCDCTATTNK